MGSRYTARRRTMSSSGAGSSGSGPGSCAARTLASCTRSPTGGTTYSAPGLPGRAIWRSSGSSSRPRCEASVLRWLRPLPTSTTSGSRTTASDQITSLSQKMGARSSAASPAPGRSPTVAPVTSPPSAPPCPPSHPPDRCAVAGAARRCVGARLVQLGRWLPNSPEARHRRASQLVSPPGPPAVNRSPGSQRPVREQVAAEACPHGGRAPSCWAGSAPLLSGSPRCQQPYGRPFLRRAARPLPARRRIVRAARCRCPPARSSSTGSVGGSRTLTRSWWWAGSPAVHRSPQSSTDRTVRCGSSPPGPGSDGSCEPGRLRRSPERRVCRSYPDGAPATVSWRSDQPGGGCSYCGPADGGDGTGTRPAGRPLAVEGRRSPTVCDLGRRRPPRGHRRNRGRSGARARPSRRRDQRRRPHGLPGGPPRRRCRPLRPPRCLARCHGTPSDP
jgi:hypothetical protein